MRGQRFLRLGKYEDEATKVEFEFKGMSIISLKVLEVKANIELNVSILFGLEVNIKVFINFIAEVFMKNSFVFLSCVWCGVAFLRGLGGHFQSRREINVAERFCLIQEKRREVRFLSLAPF